MKKLKLKKNVKRYLILGSIILFLGGSFLWTKTIIYHRTNEYKLLKLGYSIEDIEVFKESFNENDLDELSNSDYNEHLVHIIKQKYYLEKNHDEYLAYLSLKPETSYEDVIAIVNVRAQHEFYAEDVIKEADTSKKELMLVNKFNKLNETYEAENIVPVSLIYAYDDNNLNEIALENFIKMWHDAKDENLTLIISSSLRTYEEQEKLYNYYSAYRTQAYVDSISAKAGHSEHQTGYAIDILTYNTDTDNFITTPECAWLMENAYKYGFILRYPEDKKYITGYTFEPWHYRYVGIDIAKYIQENNITFDEYYAYYLEN